MAATRLYLFVWARSFDIATVRIACPNSLPQYILVSLHAFTHQRSPYVPVAKRPRHGNLTAVKCTGFNRRANHVNLRYISKGARRFNSLGKYATVHMRIRGLLFTYQ